ncbi:MAG: TolC family protein, partial [Bacteroidales bacterium]|nr:TolC family protein [Bacteroidales bacterium]
MKRALLLCFFCLAMIYLSSQNSVLTLKKAVIKGIERNITLKENEQEIHKYHSQQSESRTKLLPVIESFVNFQDNVERGVTITDGSNLSNLLYPITHTDIPYMQNRGLRFNTNAGIQLAMPLYNQSIFSAMKISDKLLEISLLGYEKAKEDLTIEICKIYYLGQINAEQILLIDQNITALTELSTFTLAFHQNGMALDVDVKRVEINLENLNMQLERTKVEYNQQINLLKYILDLPIESNFDLESVNTSEPTINLESGISSNLYELKMLDAKKEVLLKQKQAINYGYIPSLALVGQVSTINSVDKFGKYFSGENPSEWHHAFYWGLSLKVPIFDGLSKKYQSDKIQSDYLKTQMAREDAEKKLNVQYLNLVQEWKNAKYNVKRQND